MEWYRGGGGKVGEEESNGVEVFVLVGIVVCSLEMMGDGIGVVQQ